LKSLLPKEKEIENSILHYLRIRNIFAWKNETIGIFSKERGTFMKKHSKFHMTGQSDILGVFMGRFLAIEVKRPGNKPTPNQVEFISNVNKHGGIAFVATSVEDVEKMFRQLGAA